VPGRRRVQDDDAHLAQGLDGLEQPLGGQQLARVLAGHAGRQDQQVVVDRHQHGDRRDGVVLQGLGQAGPLPEAEQLLDVVAAQVAGDQDDLAPLAGQGVGQVGGQHGAAVAGLGRADGQHPDVGAEPLALKGGADPAVVLGRGAERPVDHRQRRPPDAALADLGDERQPRGLLGVGGRAHLPERRLHQQPGPGPDRQAQHQPKGQGHLLAEGRAVRGHRDRPGDDGGLAVDPLRPGLVDLVAQGRRWRRAAGLPVAGVEPVGHLLQVVDDPLEPPVLEAVAVVGVPGGVLLHGRLGQRGIAVAEGQGDERGSLERRDAEAVEQQDRGEVVGDVQALGLVELLEDVVGDGDVLEDLGRCPAGGVRAAASAEQGRPLDDDVGRRLHDPHPDGGVVGGRATEHLGQGEPAQGEAEHQAEHQQLLLVPDRPGDVRGRRTQPDRLFRGCVGHVQSSSGAATVRRARRWTRRGGPVRTRFADVAVPVIPRLR
jgi:hypothetical protein